MRHTEPKLVLAHPSVVDKVVTAIDDAALSQTRVFLFDEEECTSVRGISDWRAFVPPEEHHNLWRWPTLGSQEAQKRVASINYSSGYLNANSIYTEFITRLTFWF